jgi:hypothetical protein
MRQNNASILVGKKAQTLKNTVRSLPDTFLVFLGRTLSGHTHDSSMVKQELPPDIAWFTGLNIFVDLGYLGIKSDSNGDQSDVPHKKPRKRKKNAAPE